MKKSFESTHNKGFHMTFPNGVTASVQWGAGNYADNYEVFADFESNRGMSSNTAEVAAWLKGGEWITGYVWEASDGYVAGYLTSSEVLQFLNNCANYGKAGENGNH